MPDAEASALLREYVYTAVEYVRHGANVVRSSPLGWPILVISTERGSVELRRSLGGNMRSLFRKSPE